METEGGTRTFYDQLKGQFRENCLCPTFMPNRNGGICDSWCRFVENESTSTKWVSFTRNNADVTLISIYIAG